MIKKDERENRKTTHYLGALWHYFLQNKEKGGGGQFVFCLTESPFKENTKENKCLTRKFTCVNFSSLFFFFLTSLVWVKKHVKEKKGVWKNKDVLKRPQFVLRVTLPRLRGGLQTLSKRVLWEKMLYRIFGTPKLSLGSRIM